MTTAVDSNVVIGLWNEDVKFNLESIQLLDAARERGKLVIAAPVYVEIRAVPNREEAWVERFLMRGGIDVDWELDEAIWRLAARASHAYGVRRRTVVPPPRRIAADFVIGAHAAVRGYPLLTLDRRTFRVSFPTLRFAGEARAS